MWTTDELGLNSRWGRDVASPQHSIQIGLGTDLGNEACFLGVRQPGNEADLSPPSNAKVKGTWN